MNGQIVTRLGGLPKRSMWYYSPMPVYRNNDWCNLPNFSTVYFVEEIFSLTPTENEETITWQELYQGNTVSRDIQGYRDLQQLTNSLSSIGNEKSVSHYKLVVPATTSYVSRSVVPAGIEYGALLEPGVLYRYFTRPKDTDPIDGYVVIYVPGKGYFSARGWDNGSPTEKGQYLIQLNWKPAPKPVEVWDGSYIAWQMPTSTITVEKWFFSREAAMDFKMNVASYSFPEPQYDEPRYGSNDPRYRVATNTWNEKYFKWYRYGYGFLPAEGVDSKSLIESRVQDIFMYFNTEVRREHPIPLGLDADVCAEALSALKLNVNNLENFADIVDIAKGLLGGPVKFFKDLAKVSYKTPEDLWMSYRYVYSTTKSDIDEVQRFIQKNRTYTARGGKSTDVGRYHVKILFDLDSFEASQTFSDKLGLTPDLYNLWDMVPMSFVVDWFTDFGGLLERITNYGYARRFNVRSVTSSWKWTEKRTLDIAGIPVKCTFSSYERRVMPTLPDFIPTLDTSVKDRTLLKRVVDGVCLLIGFAS